MALVINIGFKEKKRALATNVVIKKEHVCQLRKDRNNKTIKPRTRL